MLDNSIKLSRRILSGFEVLDVYLMLFDNIIVLRSPKKMLFWVLCFAFWYVTIDLKNKIML